MDNTIYKVETSEVIAHDREGRILETRSGFRSLGFFIGTRAGVGPALVVSGKGPVFYSPAIPNRSMGVDVVCSRDQGKTWQVIELPRPLK